MAAVLVFIVLAVIGSMADRSGGPVVASGLTITSPRDGATVHTDTVVVRGTAPAGAEIVHDLSFAPDDHTTADDSGRWSMSVELDEGSNDLVFRIADDEDTERTLRVILESSTAAGSSATPRPTSTPVSCGPGEHVSLGSCVANTPPPTPVPVEYLIPTDREWALIMRSPDDYVGGHYQVWACITQFDAATGSDSFRGEASYRNEAYWYLDGFNVFFYGSDALFADFVQGDVVLMGATGLGSYTYDTQIGGSTTVPLFSVDGISRQGSC